MSKFHRQSGMVLLISLIMLLLLSQLAISGLQGTWLQERMAGNLYQREQAQQRNEQQLLQALMTVEQNANTSDEDPAVMGQLLTWPSLDLSRTNPRVTGIQQFSLQAEGPDQSGMRLTVPVNTLSCQQGFTAGWASVSVSPNDGRPVPTRVDLDADGQADLSYVGDLEGNLWRMDPEASAFERQRLFRARDAGGQPQPIQSVIAVRRHPSGLGQLLLFGTGRLGQPEDAINRQPQSLYVIWDIGRASPVPLQRSDLLRRDWLNPQGPDRFLSRDALFGEKLDWSRHRGWFIDLPTRPGTAGAERVISQVQLCGPLLLVLSIAPDSCCPPSGSRWLNLFSVADAGAPDWPVSDLNADGDIDRDDARNPDDQGPTSPVSYALGRDLSPRLLDEDREDEDDDEDPVATPSTAGRSFRLLPSPSAARATWHP